MRNIERNNNDLYKVLKSLQSNGCVFQYFEDSDFNGRTIEVQGKELLHFASCSYLGLEKHPALINGSIDAVKKYGTQTPSSRAMVSSPLYKELEGYMEQIFPGHTIITQTVTLAHCAVLPLLIHAEDAIILDAYAHNSIRMASDLCKANGTFVVVAKHNDMSHVKYLKYRLKKEGKRNIWYCADGIYSIHGDLCDVTNLHKLLDEEDDLYAYVDDAHGTGWCGKNGSGYILGSYGLHDKMIVTESFAKSMVCSGGGVVVPDYLLADVIKMTGQTMIFSGPIQPPVLGSLIECVKLHLSSEVEQFQSEILELIQYFRTNCSILGIPVVTNDDTPIQLIKIGNTEATFELLSTLVKSGYFTMTATYPAIAKGEDGIRVTLTRHISKQDIDGFLGVIKQFIAVNNIIVNTEPT
ncbi:MAG: aminotransferase class I/II-fold pyridoxal phosphate-dependent enzyme [Bacteroidetes bacterium]|nr:aminotransferase class I/II-fold pyridoxal phosphate-dependent enzyme [Bacteroidota bacterium]